ncbi:zinc ribbon domain-containing protein [Bacillus aerolatus]|uniref:zinc ribbon domain-containing protein n=1 Tax=Bacillus aerolatus TaxID=2653354 RepID=UPI0017829279|nr:zinc-ribbon domain-containing protein [Bacillus aerolatus]
MIYCKNCGEELKAGQSFCTSCGHTVQPSIEEEKISPVHKEPVSRRKKGWIAVALLLIVVTVAGWKIAESMNKPLKVVKEFEKAVDKNNAKQMAKLLNSGQDEMEVDEEAAAQLLKFYQEDPSALAETKENLRMEAKKIENDELFSKKEAGLLSIVEAGKAWGMVPKYGLDFQPVYFKVSANRKGAALKIDGRDEGKLQEDEAKTFGPYLPIPHELEASSKGEYATVEDKREIDPQEENNHKIEMEFDLRGSTVQLSSNYDEAIVFINGKSTNKTVTALAEIGPVPVDGSLKVHAEVKEKGQLLKSETVVITEDEVHYGIDLLLDDSAIREAEERAEAALAEKEANRTKDETSIENVIYDHYANITIGSLSSAYDSFSSSRKSKVGYTKWSEGFGNNIESAVSYVTVEEINGNKAVASFEMISRDDQGNGKELVQTWNGKWNLVKEGYYWKLDAPKITKTKAVTQ